MKVLFVQFVRFGIVGVLASLVHYGVAMAAIRFGVVPLAANGVAFVIAFQVSFIGHFRWSFAGKSADFSRSIRRFTMVALLGFLMNEALLWAMLKWTDIPTRISLPFVLLAVALLNFLLSKIWAFSGKQVVLLPTENLDPLS